jgi:hypothetical protein
MRKWIAFVAAIAIIGAVRGYRKRQEPQLKHTWLGHVILIGLFSAHMIALLVWEIYTHRPF